jgi:hypothetical protein
MLAPSQRPDAYSSSSRKARSKMESVELVGVSMEEDNITNLRCDGLPPLGKHEDCPPPYQQPWGLCGRRPSSPKDLMASALEEWGARLGEKASRNLFSTSSRSPSYKRNKRLKVGPHTWRLCDKKETRTTNQSCVVWESSPVEDDPPLDVCSDPWGTRTGLLLSQRKGQDEVSEREIGLTISYNRFWWLTYNTNHMD